MTILDVQQRILLTDIERPKEPLDVEILELTATNLTVRVANTEVLFHLRKREIGMISRVRSARGVSNLMRSHW